MSVRGYWILVIVTLAAEMLLGTVYLLCVALGLVGAALTLQYSGEHLYALSTLGILTMGSGIGVLLYRKNHAKRPDPMQHLDLGQQVTITSVQEDGSALVMYRGSRWLAKSRQGHTLSVGIARIIRVEGAQLIVRMQPHQKGE